MNTATDMRKRFHGCLIGGAVGDALGAPVEFMGHSEIVRRFGSGGIRDFVPAYGRAGVITDDTQDAVHRRGVVACMFVAACVG